MFWLKLRNKFDMPAEARSWSSRWLFRWLDRRIPVATHYALNRNNLYTFPTRVGFSLLFLVLILWLLGTNYQNNLILALCYLLISLFVVSILHAYRNLAGMHLRFSGAKPDFSGTKIDFFIDIQSGSAKGSHNLILRWNPGEHQRLDFCPADHVRFKLPAQSHERGYFRPGRLMLESSYPLGLIRCWTWLKLDATAIVFPKPIAADMHYNGTGNSAETGEISSLGGDEIWGLRAYRNGDYVKRVSWKSFARGGDLLTKEYAQPGKDETWLDWNYFSDLPYERKISALSYWVEKFHAENRDYGLRIPGQDYAPASGEGHRLKMLTALALMDRES